MTISVHNLFKIVSMTIIAAVFLILFTAYTPLPSGQLSIADCCVKSCATSSIAYIPNTPSPCATTNIASCCPPDSDTHNEVLSCCNFTWELPCCSSRLISKQHIHIGCTYSKLSGTGYNAWLNLEDFIQTLFRPPKV